MRLLIAEDDELVVLGLTLVIEQLGYTVCGIARTASEAVTLAELHHPDLALVDVALADGSNGLSRFLLKPFGIDALAEAVLAAFRPGNSCVPLAAA